MKHMLRLACLASASILLAGTAFAADLALPNLIGTWSTRSEGTMVVRGKDPGARLHYPEGSSTLVGEATFTKQSGRLVEGTFKTPKATEPFVGAFGLDGRTIYAVDTDGLFDLRVVDADTLEVVYRHATPTTSVVSVGTWTRKR
jgi:hypothetical protein